jgi:MFS family permease
MSFGPDRRNVAAVGVLLACVSGFGFYSLTIYVSALTEAFSLSTVSRASSLFLLTSGLGGTLVGALLVRVDIRMVFGLGALLMASGLGMLGRVHTSPGLYGAYFLLGLGQAGAGVIPGFALVTRWFDPHQRKTAMTLAATGLSLGGIAIAPLVALGLRHHSLSSVTTVAALALVGLCLLATLAVTPSPGALVSAAVAALDEGMSRAAASRTRAFWTVTAAQTCATFAQVGGLTHLFALVTQRGSPAVAGEAISAVALGSLSGRFLGGVLLARTSTLAFYRGLLVAQFFALLTLGLEHSTPTLLATSALFGFTIGNILLSHPLLLGELFGPRDFARILGLSALVATVGTAAGPVVLGQVRTATGHWSGGYFTVACGSLLGAGLLLALAPPRASHAPTSAHEPVLTVALPS